MERLEVERVRPAPIDPGRAEPSQTAHRLDVDGLRGVAITAVLLYHAGVAGAAGGYVGVDAFFVLSGFLITGLLWREVVSTGGISLRSFYARRVRRLLPASSLVIVATVVASRIWLPPLRASSVTTDAIASTVYVANHRFASAGTDYLEAAATPSPLQHFWSLAVEEQFYVLWPALVLLATSAWQRGGPASRRPSRARGFALLSLLGAVSFAACVVWTRRAPTFAFYSLPTRTWEFVVGGLVALAVPELRRLGRSAGTALAAAGASAFVWSVLHFDGGTRFPGAAALVPVAGTAAIVAAGCSATPGVLSRALGCRPLVAVGRVSYSWYLWHWPALVIGAAIAGRALTVAEGLALVAASGALAALTLRLVEDPVRHSQRLVATPRLAVGLAAVLMIVAAGAAWTSRATLPARHGTAEAASVPTIPLPTPGARPVPLGAGAGIPSTVTSTAAARPIDGDATTRASTVAPTTAAATTTTVHPALAAAASASGFVAAAIADAVTATAVPANLKPSLGRAHGDRARPFDDGCFAGFSSTQVGDCTYGEPAGASTIALFGDSHAAAWFPAVEPAATARGWRLQVFSKATCPPLLTPVWAPNFGREYRECDAWRAAVLERMRADPPAVVLLGANRAYGPAYHLPNYEPPWLTGLADMIAAIRSTGATVVVLGPVPLPPNDLPDCLSAHLQSVQECAPSATDPYVLGGIEAERATTVAAGAAYLDVRPWFCTPATCAVIVGDLLVYRDQNHLATPFAGWLSPVLGAEVDAILATRPPPTVADGSAP